MTEVEDLSESDPQYKEAIAQREVLIETLGIYDEELAVLLISSGYNGSRTLI